MGGRTHNRRFAEFGNISLSFSMPLRNEMSLNKYQCLLKCLLRNFHHTSRCYPSQICLYAFVFCSCYISPLPPFQRRCSLALPALSLSLSRLASAARRLPCRRLGLLHEGKPSGQLWFTGLRHAEINLDLPCRQMQRPVHAYHDVTWHDKLRRNRLDRVPYL